MNLGIVGSRHCTMTVEALEKLIQYISTHYVIRQVDTIISGGAKGADTLADNYARIKGLKLIVHYPKLHLYETKGNKVYFERNLKIATDSDVLLALYNPSKQSGTANTVRYATELNKTIFTYDYDNKKLYSKNVVKRK